MTGVQTGALPISGELRTSSRAAGDCQLARGPRLQFFPSRRHRAGGCQACAAGQCIKRAGRTNRADGVVAGQSWRQRVAERITVIGARQSATRVLTDAVKAPRSEEHTSELQSLMRISYAVFCLQ